MFDFITQYNLSDLALAENRGFGLTLSAITGIIDGINLCSIHLILLFIGYLLLYIKDRSKAAKVGTLFIFSIFFSYFLFGAALSNIIGQLIGWQYYYLLQDGVQYFLIAILMIWGLINFINFFYPNKFIFNLHSPEEYFLKHNFKYLDYSVAIILGFLSSLFLLPCSLPLYLPAVHVLTSVYGPVKTIFYIFIYSLTFILPMFVIFAFILRTQRYFIHKEIGSQKYRWLKLIKGSLQIIIAILLFLLFRS